MYYNLNVYDNVKTPTTTHTITTNQWFDLIRSSEYTGMISMARKGLIDYEVAKTNIPAITYNFSFNGYKTNDNIISSTGLIYIDIDNDTFDISTLDLTKVYSYYRSFGGKGYAILAKVDNLSIDNFKDTYISICTDLGIDKYIDTNAIKATQYSVLSSDKDIYINENSFIYSGCSQIAPPSIVKRKEIAYTVEGGAVNKKIFTSIDFIAESLDEKYTIDWNGIEYYNCFLPIKKLRENRYKFILSYSTNLLCLNPNLTYEEVLSTVRNACRISFEKQYSFKKMEAGVEAVYEMHLNNKLQPIWNKKSRKIVFAKDCGLDKEEKLAICRNEIAKKRIQDSKEKIYNILENWDFKTHGKISQRKIYDNHNVTKKTVEKYWNEFKKYIKEINDEN